MKTISLLTCTVALLGFATLGHAEDNYSVFKVCEDQHVIRTSDGAEAGHIEYIVTDPADGRIVSSIVSGGTIGEKMVVVPYSSMRFGAEREVTLTEITRERLVSAPVIERSQINVAVRFEPTVVERSFTHFGVRRDGVRTSATSRVEERETLREGATAPGSGNPRENERPRSTTAPSATTREPGTAREENTPSRDSAHPKGDAGREGQRPAAEATKDADRPRSEALRNGERPKADAEHNATEPESKAKEDRPGQ